MREYLNKLRLILLWLFCNIPVKCFSRFSLIPLLSVSRIRITHFIYHNINATHLISAALPLGGSLALNPLSPWSHSPFIPIIPTASNNTVAAPTIILQYLFHLLTYCTGCPSALGVGGSCSFTTCPSLPSNPSSSTLDLNPRSSPRFVILFPSLSTR